MTLLTVAIIFTIRNREWIFKDIFKEINTGTLSNDKDSFQLSMESGSESASGSTSEKKMEKRKNSKKSYDGHEYDGSGFAPESKEGDIAGLESFLADLDADAVSVSVSVMTADKDAMSTGQLVALDVTADSGLSSFYPEDHYRSRSGIYSDNPMSSGKEGGAVAGNSTDTTSETQMSSGQSQSRGKHTNNNTPIKHQYRNTPTTHQHPTNNTPTTHQHPNTPTP
jgi:hypothetical protein